MKKTILRLSAILLAFALLAPFAALAAAAPPVAAPQAGCAHSSYTSSYYYSYIPLNDTYHEVYRTERRRCNSCNDIFYVGNPVALPLAEHSIPESWTYSYEDHSGDPASHYVVYVMKCPMCGLKVGEKTSSTFCRNNYCNRIQSIGDPVLLLR